MSSLRDAVRDKLREDKVKLWLPPYDDASKVDALAKAYAAAWDWVVEHDVRVLWMTRNALDELISSTKHMDAQRLLADSPDSLVRASADEPHPQPYDKATPNSNPNLRY